MENQTTNQPDDQQGNLEEFKQMVSSGEVELGNGARFWAYIEQQDGNWSGTITSKDPQANLQTPGLSGVFKVTVTAKYGAGLQPRQLKPQQGSKPEVGCNSNCAAMVGIVATPGGGDAQYWTVWDAYCNGGISEKE